MTINNFFISESLQYKNNGKITDIFDRENEIKDLLDVLMFCKEISEPVYKTSDIYYINISKDLKLCDFLYQVGCASKDEDIHRLLQEIFEKYLSLNDNVLDGADHIINISLGKYNNCKYDKISYLQCRRDILGKISNALEYCEFMSSCLPNCIFADDIHVPMKGISDFKEHNREITDCLCFLNDNAIRLYEENKNNLNEAIKQISTGLKSCSLESSKHKSAVTFKFSYEEYRDGNTLNRYKYIECSPHLKLIRENSDLRIYFYWADKNVGHGQKVLIGRIGSHPY